MAEQHANKFQQAIRGVGDLRDAGAGHRFIVIKDLRGPTLGYGI